MGITFAKGKDMNISLLGILLIGLKLAEVGTVGSWPWLWVLSPFWIGITMWLAIVTISAIVIACSSKRNRFYKFK